MAACIICGVDDFKRDDPRHLYAQPNTYHAHCHARFHAALWRKELAGKTVAQIREIVAKEIAGGGGKA